MTETEFRVALQRKFWRWEKVTISNGRHGLLVVAVSFRKVSSRVLVDPVTLRNCHQRFVLAVMRGLKRDLRAKISKRYWFGFFLRRP